MKSKNQERQSRYRDAQSTKKKTPLTFYRSAGEDGENQSPFSRKQAEAAYGRLGNFIAGFFEWIIFLTLIGVLAYSLVIRPSSKVEVSSQQFHQKIVYEQAANKILSGVKYSNKLSFQESDLTDRLQNQFPEIASARVELPIFDQRPIVHLQIASPSFILKSNNESYIVDSQGVAVAKTADYPGITGLMTVDDQSGFNTQVGKQVMSADSVKFINTLTKQSKLANVPVSSLTMPPTAQELDLRTSDRNYYVKFYLGGDVALQSGQFLASRHQFDATNSQPAEYLDARIPGKVFYK